MYVSRGDVVILSIHPKLRARFKNARPAVALRRNADGTVTFALMKSKIDGNYTRDVILRREETGLNKDGRVTDTRYVDFDDAAYVILQRLPEEKVKEIVDRC